MAVRVTVESRCPDRDQEVEALALAAQGHPGSGPLAEDELRIVLLDSSSELWDHRSRRKGMSVGFTDIDLRTGAGNLSRRQPLAKAMGTRTERVLDATGGFGHDSALLACMGWTVICVERVPLLATLLELGIRESRRNPDLVTALGGRLTVQQGDAIKLLSGRPTEADVIYLDPMFEAGGRKRGSALPRKPAQLLQRIAGNDSDASQLLDLARANAHRVVVKRPDDGPVLGGTPDLVFKGRLVRYDVYLRTGHGSIE